MWVPLWTVLGMILSVDFARYEKVLDALHSSLRQDSPPFLSRSGTNLWRWTKHLARV